MEKNLYLCGQNTTTFENQYSMKIIGRQKEIESLRRFVASEQSEFIAVYGRRRVGKTFLIRNLLGNMFAFAATGILEGEPSEQRKSFQASLQDYGCKDCEFGDWLEAFGKLRALLEQKNRDEPLVVFIDELPCFDTQRSNFVHALGYFWNNWAAWQGNIKLIVCGSATSWMTRNLLNSKGGLHNRLTQTIWLRQFTLAETEAYLKNAGFLWARESVAQCYMIMGGIPYYLSMLDSHQSLSQNIDRLFFASDGKLKEEFYRLYGSLFKNPTIYLKVIDLLAAKKYGMTRKELAKEIDSGGKLTDVLSDLQQCGFIGRMGVRAQKGGIKSTNGIYHLTDFYTRFYYDFCRNKTSDEHYWTHKLATPKMNTWWGLAYERLCMAHIPQIKQALGISAIYTEYYSWRSKLHQPAAQIDLLIERADNMINLCEIKYSQGQYAMDKTEYEKIQNRLAAFRDETNCRQGIFLTLITTKEPKQNECSSMMNGVVLLDDLFKE